MADQAIHVDGLQELFRAFAVADRALVSDLRDAVAEAAAPVRNTAQVMAPAMITRLQPADDWARMRIGVTGNTAYVAPVERGAKSRGRRQRYGRRKFFPILLRPMESALAANRQVVMVRFNRLLAEVERVWETP